MGHNESRVKRRKFIALNAYIRNWKHFHTSELKEDIRGQKDLPCPQIRKINILKMAILPKTICRSNAIPMKIATQLFIECEWTIFSFIWKHTQTKTLLSNKRMSRGITASQFKLYYRAKASKIPWYCHKSLHVGQWHQIKQPDVSSQSYGHLIFVKQARNTQ